jgi:hypothetical protein
METWLSGRKRLTANEVGSKSPRRFESSRLRLLKIPPSGGYFLKRRRSNRLGACYVRIRRPFEIFIELTNRNIQKVYCPCKERNSSRLRKYQICIYAIESYYATRNQNTRSVSHGTNCKLCMWGVWQSVFCESKYS